MKEHRSQRFAPKPIYEDDYVRISRLGTGVRRLVLCFSGVGLGNVPVQKEEFIGTSLEGGGSTALYAFDKHRTWYNGPGVIEKIAEVARDTVAAGHIESTVAVGNSMGGFGAVLISHFLDVDVSVALSPQYSIDKSVIKREHRWDPYTDLIDPVRFRELGPYFNSSTRYFIAHGSGGPDWRHIRLFPKAPNINHYVLRGGDHNIARYLKQNGLLKPFMAHCMDGDVEQVDTLIGGRRVPEGGMPYSMADFLHKVLPDGPWFP